MSNRLPKRALHSKPRESHAAALRPGAAPLEALEPRLLLAAQPLRTIAGRIFNDLNGNATRQLREHWLAGVVVYLDLNGNGAQDAADPAVLTNKAGAFAFRRLPRGAYTVVAIPPAGDIATLPVSGSKTVDVTKRSALSLRFGMQAAVVPPVGPDKAPPSANLNAPAITSAGFAPYRFDVTWSDATAVDASSFGDGNLVVTNSNGVSQPAGLVALDSAVNGPLHTTTYQIPAPAGGWTVDTDGTYTVNLVGGQIRDTLGNVDGAIAIGTFRVEIPGAVPGAPSLLGGINSVTASNNASSNARLSFDIANTVAGAVLTLEADGVPIASTVAADGSTIVATPGHPALSDGPHVFAITQTLANGVESTSAPATITIDTAGPTASLLAPTLVAAGGSTYAFTVTYTDATAVQSASIAGHNLLVTTPSGQRLTPTLVSLDANSNGPTRVAQYRISAPGGAWSAGSNGQYAVALQSNEVFDLVHNPAPARVLGDFAVSIGQSLSPVTGTPALAASSDTGVYNNDNVTNLNNSSSANRLQISVPGVQNGALVTVFSDGTPIGSATASGGSAAITTNAGVTLSNGAHLITASQTIAGQGPSNASSPLGIVVDTQAPVATSSPAPVNGFGSTSYSFAVVYTDNIAVDAAHLASGNVIVSGPLGYSQAASLQTVSSHTSGSPRTATYVVTPPGGSWDSSDDGTYTLSLQGGQVFDTAGNSSGPANIASFVVNAGLPASPAPATPALAPGSDSGISSSDAITNLNNAAPQASLQFSVGNTIAGATVTVYADGVPIGAAVASGSATAVIANGTTPLGDGPHTITARQTLPGDAQSSDSPGTTITIDTAQAAVASVHAPDVSSAGAAAYTFTVTYVDATGIDPATLGGGNVAVLAPGNVVLPASFLSASPGNAATSVTATYQLTPPGGAWGASDNGAYALALQANQVRDLAGNVSAGANIGSFLVNVPVPTTASPGAAGLAPASDTGPNPADGLTKLNNASPAQAMQFTVGNTISGATVTVFADGVPIGAAVASGNSATVTTLGSVPLSNGPHTITARQQSPGEDQSPDSVSSTITVDTVPPVAGSLSAGAVTTGGGTSYSFTVKYTDARSVDFSSLDNNDVLVIAPGNVMIPASFVSSAPSVNSASLVATYQITPPGGSWDSSENGNYSVALNGGQVGDTAGNFASAASLGLFTVNIGMTAAPGAASLAVSSDTGGAHSDGVTNLNNSAPSQALRFVVGNTIPGATVTVYSDGTPIGAAVASASTTTVATTGSTTLADGGHTITARQQSPGQPLSNPSASALITIDTAPPTAAVALSDVTAAGALTYTFAVTYSDGLALDPSTFDGNDIVVTGPNGFSAHASLAAVDNTTSGTPRTATYLINAPATGWSSADNGQYTVTLFSGQVFDLAGNPVAPGDLGTFQVNIAP